MNTKDGFKIILAKPPDYERLTVEIHFKGKFVAMVSQEGAEGSFDLETPRPELNETRTTRKIDLKLFQKALAIACKRLSTGI